MYIVFIFDYRIFFLTPQMMRWTFPHLVVQQISTVYRRAKSNIAQGKNLSYHVLPFKILSRV